MSTLSITRMVLQAATTARLALHAAHRMRNGEQRRDDPRSTNPRLRVAGGRWSPARDVTNSPFGGSGHVDRR